MARRRSGERYLGGYLADGYNITKEKEAEYAKAYQKRFEKATGEKFKLTDDYERIRKSIKNGPRTKNESVADQLRGVNSQSGIAEKRRDAYNAAHKAKKTIDKGRNILKSSTNDPGEKVMGMGKKKSTTAKKAAKSTTKAPNKKLTTYAPNKKLTQKKK